MEEPPTLSPAVPTRRAVDAGRPSPVPGPSHVRSPAPVADAEKPAPRVAIVTPSPSSLAAALPVSEPAARTPGPLPAVPPAAPDAEDHVKEADRIRGLITESLGLRGLRPSELPVERK